MAKKAIARRKKSGATTRRGMGPSPTTRGKAPYQFRGRTIQILPPNMNMSQPGHQMQGTLRVDGRDVMYEQTDDGVYSHEMMYQRFSTPEELAEELVRQWGTHIPSAAPMPPMPMSAPRANAGAKSRSSRARRRK